MLVRLAVLATSLVVARAEIAPPPGQIVNIGTTKLHIHCTGNGSHAVVLESGFPARRTKEIGVRMALGAKAGSVIWIVMKEVLLLLGIGLAMGVPAAILLGRFVSAQLFGVKAQDPWVAGLSIILLFFVASLAGSIPARRASRIDPILALRYE